MQKRAICIFVLLAVLINIMIPERVDAVSAQSAITIEVSSGKVLFEKNAHTRLPMASTTKIITAICAI